MKKFFNSPARFLAVISALLLIIFWSIWFFAFRYYLIWLEGFSYFSTLPDFAAQYRLIPEGLPGYIGAFLHQFYSMPVLGAAIQAFFTIWPTVCIGIILNRLFKEPVRLIWIAFIPMIFIARRQFWDLLMYKTVIYSMIATGLMLLTVIATSIRRPAWNLPNFLRNKYLTLIFISLQLSNSIFVIVALEPRNREFESRAELEYLGERGQWDEILRIIQPRDAKEDTFKRGYALLALSEKGILPDYAFRYGLASSEDFIFRETIEPMLLNFNALFFQCNDMYNASVHQSYQHGVQSVTGMSFSSLRRLADVYLEVGDYELAKKYLEILSHSTCHKKWVEDRLDRLETIRYAEPEYEAPMDGATIASFTHTVSSMVDRNKDVKKYSDLLLCALLADEEGDKFKKIFSYIAPYQYPAGKAIPRLYEEALVLISMVDPHILDNYVISEDTVKRFSEYVTLMNARQGNQALRKYADTYWAYSY